LVNGLLAGIGFGFTLLGVPGAPYFLFMNVILGVFNLLPAFPMDGGRVLRAWWSRKMSPRMATERALKVSRLFAWAFVGLGLVYSASLLLVGAFLLFSISVERRRQQHHAEFLRQARWKHQA